MKNVKKLLLNTLLLTATALFMRTVGMAFNVYLTNRIGSAGIGLFQLIMSVYSMSVTFASSGIRLAATRLVIEELSSRNGQVRAVMWRCVLYGLWVPQWRWCSIWERIGSARPGWEIHAPSCRCSCWQ